MHKYILLLLFNCFYLPGHAQQDAHFSQYVFNGLVINPAYAGSKEEISSAFFYRNQFGGFPSAPVIESFTIHTPLNYQRAGVGIKFLNESFNGYKDFNLSGIYSYKINFADGVLSAGIEAGVRRYSLNLDKINIKDPNDKVLSSENKKASFDLGAGLYYQKKNFYLGFSVQHLPQSKINFTSYQTGNATLKRHYYLISAYQIKISEQLSLSPALLVKYVEHIPMQMDLTAYLKFQEIFWTGISYRTSMELSFQAGIQVNKISSKIREKIKIGYSYDFGFSNLYNYNSGTHEIMIICDFLKRPDPEKIKKRKIITSPLLF